MGGVNIPDYYTKYLMGEKGLEAYDLAPLLSCLLDDLNCKVRKRDKRGDNVTPW